MTRHVCSLTALPLGILVPLFMLPPISFPITLFVLVILVVVVLVLIVVPNIFALLPFSVMVAVTLLRI